MENWGGEISEHIADTNFGLLLHDMIQQTGVIVYATDLDGDRLTDLMADAPDFLRAWGQMVLDKVKPGTDMNKVWSDMGFTMKNGKDMTSVMYRMVGEPIYEQTLGSADAMLLRLLEGDETEGGTKQPYDPRIHFVLINEAYKAANPGNQELAKWLDAQLATFDKVYGGKRPRYLDGYNKLKEAIKPWGDEVRGRRGQRAIKKAARGRPFLLSCRVLSAAFLDVRGLLALRALHHVEADFLTFFQGLEAGHVDRGEMREQVLAAVVGRDEAVAFRVVEPLHGACCHALSLIVS